MVWLPLFRGAAASSGLAAAAAVLALAVALPLATPFALQPEPQSEEVRPRPVFERQERWKLDDTEVDVGEDGTVEVAGARWTQDDFPSERAPEGGTVDHWEMSDPDTPLPVDTEVVRSMAARRLLRRDLSGPPVDDEEEMDEDEGDEGDPDDLEYDMGDEMDEEEDEEGDMDEDEEDPPVQVQPSTPTAPAGGGRGESCGGLAALKCAPELVCVEHPQFPDVGGTCQPPSGTAPPPTSAIPAGEPCVLDPAKPTLDPCETPAVCTGWRPGLQGVCARPAAKLGEPCGGVLEIRCEAGLACLHDGLRTDTTVCTSREGVTTGQPAGEVGRVWDSAGSPPISADRLFLQPEQE